MPVNNKHYAYTQSKKRWDRCRDTIQGQDAVYARGETYLPRLAEQDDKQYDAYKLRARFLNAMQRTIDGLTGLVMRKDPLITGEFDNIQFNADDTFSTQQYMNGVLEEILSVGRGGTFIDMPEVPEELTVAQAEELKIRPLWSYYQAEDILNWRKNEEDSYVMVSLREYVTRDLEDEFATDQIEQYRVLDLEPETGFYRQRVFNEAGQPIIDPIFPLMNGVNMTSIPFIEHGTFKPPLMDVADNNLHHYRLQADLNHGLHFVALPTPWITGVDPNDAPTSIGPHKMWVFENENAKVGLLEFEGQGLEGISKEITKIEKNMAQLGARMLSDMPTNDETATAAEIRSSAETSALSNIVSDLNEDFGRIAEITLEWITGSVEDEESAIGYNTDLMPRSLDPQSLVALVQTWQAGAITIETLIENLQKGEIVESDVTTEEYVDELEDQLPASKPGVDDVDDDNDGLDDET